MSGGKDLLQMQQVREEGLVSIHFLSSKKRSRVLKCVTDKNDRTAISFQIKKKS